MPVSMSIDSSSSVRHLTRGHATLLSTSDLQFPPRKITGSESNEDESLREWERREKLNLEERRGGANPSVVQVHAVYEDEAWMHTIMDLCTGPNLLDWVLEPTAARIMVAWRSSPRRSRDATAPG